MIMFLNDTGIRGFKQSPLKPGLGQGRATSQGLPSPPPMDIGKGTGPPRSSGISRELLSNVVYEEIRQRSSFPQYH